jgi:hypothetical protein
MDSRDLVSVYSLKDPHLAELIKGLLNSEGVPCHVEGGGQAGLTGIIDIKIIVRAADGDRAARIIRQHLESRALKEDQEEAP